MYVENNPITSSVQKTQDGIRPVTCNNTKHEKYIYKRMITCAHQVDSVYFLNPWETDIHI